MKVKQIKLYNFQAHESLLVKFAPGVNAIVGPTDAGKSAVLRALGWVCLNDIPGDDFVREGQKQTTVRMKVTHKGKDAVIGRVRSLGGKNLYTLHDAAKNTDTNIDAREFKAFGVNVPQDIAELVALSPINFQKQHDPSFWFSDTAGEVSRKLNAVIDLSVIDSSLSYVAAQVRRHLERESICQDRLAELQQELKELEPQKERIHEFEKLETMRERAVELEADRDELEELLRGVHTHRKNRDRSNEQNTEASDLFEECEAVLELHRQRGALAGIVSTVEDLTTRAKSPPDFGTVERHHSTAVRLADEVEELADGIETVQELLQQKRKAEAAFEAAESRFHKYIKGARCPLCQNVIQ